MAKGLIVTGSWMLNFRLSRLPEKLQKKAIKKACREAAKKEVLPRIKQSIRSESYNTGAMHDAVKVRTTTRNIKANTGKVKEFTKRDGTIGQFNVKRVVAQEFGAKVEITRKELNKQLAKRGKNEIEKDGYFYPAAVEMGTFYSVPQKPMRRVIPDAKKPTTSIFEAELRKALRTIK